MKEIISVTKNGTTHTNTSAPRDGFYLSPGGWIARDGWTPPLEDLHPGDEISVTGTVVQDDGSEILHTEGTTVTDQENRQGKEGYRLA